jgi:hypothetical protein
VYAPELTPVYAPEPTPVHAPDPAPPSESVTTTSDEVPCPICRTTIHRGIFDAFLKTCQSKRPNTREKLRFCEQHKLAEAQQELIQYPIVDWEQLPLRLFRLQSTIYDLITRARPSTYRSAIESSSSKDIRRLLRTPEGGNVVVGGAGYYGERGSRIISDFLLQYESAEIGKAAQTERIYKELGVAGFIQCVLIPEVAWRLISEDLAVNEDEAKEVLKATSAAGSILRPDEAEAVYEESEEGEVEVEAGRGVARRKSKYTVAPWARDFDISLHRQ